jgi:hypothetical protein
MERNSKIGNGVRLTNEIKELLDQDRINQQAANRLLLLAVTSILEDLGETRAAVKINTESRERYPSMVAIFSQSPKRMMLLVLVTYLLLHTLAETIPVAELQRALAVAIGLPLK